MLDLLNYAWVWQPKQGNSLCDCSFRGSSEEYSPTKPHVLFVNNTVQIKITSPKTHTFKKLYFSCISGIELKSSFFAFFTKLMHHCNFVWENFKIHPNYTLHWASRYCTRKSYLPFWFGKATLIRHTKYLLRLQETAHLEWADASHLSDSLPLQMLWISSVVFLARLQRVQKMVRILLCVFVTLFISTNKTRTLALFSTMRQR
jgi:hypothetical protein